jgi:hypothetical protein
MKVKQIDVIFIANFRGLPLFLGPGSAKSLLQIKQTQSMPDRGEICCTLSSPNAT